MVDPDGVDVRLGGQAIAGAAEEVGGGPDKLGVLGKQGGLVLEVMGEPFVVGVEKGDPGGAGVGDAGVAGGGGASVRLADVLDQGREFRGEGSGVVGRAVVNDDDFGRGGSLGQDAGNSAVETGGGVVGWDDDADINRFIG